MPRSNEEVEELLTEWAELLQISGADLFRVRAYEKAARAIGGYARDLRDLSDPDILAIPTVGKNMATRAREYLDTGTMHELEDLREMVPGGMRELLRIPGLGPKKAALLHAELGVSSIDDLAKALAEHKLRGIKGLGPKSEDNLTRSLRNLERHGARILVDQALSTAEMVIEAIRGSVDVERITYAGSLRRMRDTIGDIDILVAADHADPIMEVFATMDRVEQVLARGDTKSSVITTKGVQVDLRVIPEDSWGAALIYFTGSKAHNIKIREMAVRKGLKLSEWGLFNAEDGKVVAARSEEDVYEALELAWIPPTLREDNGEVEAALEGNVPELVTAADIQGDLHSHTDMTDGVAPLEDMVAAAAGRGYAYYVVTDHAQNLSMTGVGREKMLEQRVRIEALQRRYATMSILHGSELNIARDGSVDYDAEFLASYDLCVASVHSMFNLPRDEQTRRVIRAIENPNVHVIGHPSGRLIGRREPIDVDWDAVFDAAARTGTAMEVNSFPDRLDLCDEHVRWAIGRGVTISIDTDSHSTKDLSNLRFGIATAQRGWACAEHVLNARPLTAVRDFVARKRSRA